jgi:hypothetical protein
MNKTVLIIGDSWGCGEWEWDSKKGEHITPNKHLGLEQYLTEDGFAISNVSVPGQSNLEALSNAAFQPIHSFDYIVWIVTDALRDLSYVNKNYNELTSYADMIADSEFIMKHTFTVANNFNVPILCMGGCAILPQYINQYPNLTPAIPSLTKFLLPGFHHPKLWASTWFNHVETAVRKMSLVDRDTFITDVLREKSKQDSLKNEHLFTPDGLHPNRYAWKIVYDYLRENYIK